MQQLQDPRISVTILTGFLGAGKTTLLNSLLKQNPDKKIVVLENEFGEQNIDNDLVIQNREALFSLAAGCLCCDLNSELVETLRQISEIPPIPSHLVIETTGIADPGGVVRPFLEDPLIRSAFRLDGVLCVVDAGLINMQLARNPEAARQIASADWIVLNKTDKIQNTELPQLEQMLQDLNSDARIATAVQGVIESDANPLELKSWDLFAAEKRWSELTETEIRHHEIVSHGFALTQEFDLAKFDTWMRQLLGIQGENIYRTKGILAIAGVDRKLVFQSVQGDYMAGFTTEWTEDEPRTSRLVFLGKNLRRDILATRLRSCMAHQPSPYRKSTTKALDQMALPTQD